MTSPLVGHMSLMTFYGFHPPLMQGWVTHGLDFYDVPTSESSAAKLAAFAKYGIPSFYGDLPGSVFTRGVGLTDGWEPKLEALVKTDVLPHLGEGKAYRGFFLGDELCCGAGAKACWEEGFGPLTAKLRVLLGPEAIIYANECGDIANPEMNVTSVPPGFDLISVDAFAGYTKGSRGMDEVAVS